MQSTDQSQRILVIDDEPSNLKLVDKILQKAGHRAPVLISDPRESLDAYTEQRPDLILLDLNMPHMDGYAVIRALQSLDDPLLPPIIILTAQHDREHFMHALKAGARDFISKPFDSNELLIRVRNMLEAQYAFRMLHDRKMLLEHMVAQRTEELRQTRLQVVQRLGRAAEYRDEETGNHILRMSHMSSLLAEAAGWQTNDVELMLHASPMHDIGKIGIPDHILLKPGRFDADEWETMKTHTLIGARLLDGDDSPLLTLAREIAISHHERWDGSGYPYNLSGEHIPQSGRIVALADVFDALTSERPYKKPWPIAEAKNHILDNSGSHFDPALVALFDKHWDEILEIRERFSEAPPPHN